MSSENNYILHGEPVPKCNKLFYNSLGSLYLDKLRKTEDHVVFINIDGDNLEKITTKEILLRSATLAAGLVKYGIKPGDTIGIYAENHSQFVYVLVAAFSIGAILTPINSTYKEVELDHVIGLSRPKLIFASSNTIGRLIRVTSELKFVKKLIQLTDDDDTIYGNEVVTKYSEFVSGLKPLNHFPCESIADGLDEVALILYSSGTTGKPKGVQLSHNNIIRGLERRTVYPHLRYLSCLPWFHTYGFRVLNTTLLFCTETVLIKRFNDRSFLSCIEKYKINYIFSVPAIISFLAKSPLTENYDLSSIRIVYTGGAPLPMSLIESIRVKYNAPVRQGYGMTETFVAVINQTDARCSHGSIGGLAFDTMGKVIDTETGKCLGPNQHGELVFKSSSVMKGYLNAAKETRETIDEDGWIHTGDIGYYDDNREWFIVDRIKELIKFKGFQVAPAELETVLINHPRILDAAVIGIPDDVAGELPMAFVVLKPGTILTKSEIQNYVAGKVSSPKHLRGGVEFVDVIPRNAAAKIMRRQLRERITGYKSKL